MGEAKQKAIAEAQRAFKAKKQYAKFVKAWKFGLAGFALAFLLLPYIIFRNCYEEEKWPWQL